MRDERQNIIETIFRFANGLDLKDWQAVRACFTDKLLTDYSDLRGEAPIMMQADEYVAKRQTALGELKTQHLSSNHVVIIQGDTATCASQMIIFRRLGERFFNTHCYYEHHLIRSETGWKINAIKQKVFWNEGDSSIHSGAKK